MRFAFQLYSFRSFLALMFLFTVCQISLVDVALAESQCSELFQNSNPHNINATKPMSEYTETFDRNFNAYESKLGAEFTATIKQDIPLNWFDSGAGLGLAPLQLISEGRPIQATVVNAQNAWEYVLDPNSPNATSLFNTVYRAAGALHAKEINWAVRIGYDAEGYEKPIISNQWREILTPAINNKLQEKSSQFHYKVGFSEDVLVKSEKTYDVITDVFGAYFYSINRLDLINLYYLNLKPGGKAFVILWALDKNWSNDPANWKQYGVESKIEGSEKKLEDWLVERFPTIFSIHTEEIHPHGSVRSLVIRKDPNVELDMHKIFNVIQAYYDKNHSVPIQRQIPTLKLRLL